MEHGEEGYRKGVLYHLDIDLLHHDPNQPRKYFDKGSLKELEDSIRTQGVLEPILFRTEADGKLVIVAGARRCKAAVNAGLSKIPAIFTDGNAAEIGIVENLLREDLTAIEEAEALDKLTKHYGYTHEQLAQTLGKGRSTISEMLSLMKLPRALRDECRGNPGCPRRVLLEIAKKSDEKSMWRLYFLFRKQNLTGDEVRKIARGGPGPVHAAIKLLKSMNIKIESLNFDSVEKSDEATLRAELERLERAIKFKLVQLSSVGAPTQLRK